MIYTNYSRRASYGSGYLFKIASSSKSGDSIFLERQENGLHPLQKIRYILKRGAPIFVTILSQMNTSTASSGTVHVRHAAVSADLIIITACVAIQPLQLRRVHRSHARTRQSGQRAAESRTSTR